MAPPSSLPALPVTLQPFVHHHVADNVLICITSGCKQAIAAKTMRQHLHRQHRVPSTLFPQLHTWITSLPPLADPETLPPRPPNTPQDPFLALHHVFQCAGCGLIQGTQKGIKQHARQAHVEPVSPHFEMAIPIVAQTWSARKNMMYWPRNKKHGTLSQLKVVCAVFDRIVARAIATLHATDPDLLMWLLSPKNKAPKQKPFALLQDKETLP
ncbi:MAG: hypothetical protein M1826_000361 [Phylliscum demangeonii]|nr:MAG: hypothetical protein M1826_000361 [Phylliscum demangeonii]